MTTRSCPKCSLLMARCDFKYCPDCGARLGSSSPSDETACSALAAKWGKQADMLLAQKKDFVDRGYSSSLIQMWDTVAGVLNDCKTELEKAISSQNSVVQQLPKK